MAQSYETNTTTQELGPLFAEGNDFDQRSDTQAKYEYTVHESEDGKSLRVASTIHLNPLHRIARETNDYSDSASLYGPFTRALSVHEEMRALDRSTHTDVKPLMHFLGFTSETHVLDENGSTTIEATVPRVDLLGDRLDEMQLPPEHAVVRPLAFEGVDYTSREFYTALADGYLLDGKEPHDIAFHAPALILLPPTVVLHIADIGLERISDADAHQDMSTHDYWKKKKHLGEHLINFDLHINVMNLVRDINTALTQPYDPTKGLHRDPMAPLKYTLSEMLGDKMDIDQAVALTLDHVRYMIERAQQLSTADISVT